MKSNRSIPLWFCFLFVFFINSAANCMEKLSEDKQSNEKLLLSEIKEYQELLNDVVSSDSEQKELMKEMCQKAIKDLEELKERYEKNNNIDIPSELEMLYHKKHPNVSGCIIS